MGESATRRHVTGVISALEKIFAEQGIVMNQGRALEAAKAVYRG